MFLGLDFGTTGARACVVDSAGVITHSDHIDYHNPATQTPEDWRTALLSLLQRIPQPISEQLLAIAVDATSSTVLLCDGDLTPLAPALLYQDARAIAQASSLKKMAPPGHMVCSPTSGLAKFLWLAENSDIELAHYYMHQADWLGALLSGIGGSSDYHNALKSGYDVVNLCWPEWMTRLPRFDLLPDVLPPGSEIAAIDAAVARYFSINPACIICAGTTDSIAAFMATEAKQPGVAVTSLGTTLVLKLLSEHYVEAAEFGVYSHKYGDLWLAGGASNAGGSVLRQYFTDQQLTRLSLHIDPAVESSLDYYPLPRTGERFPINNPNQLPRLTPRPADDVEFLHGILQALSRIEADGYAKLSALGASPLKSVVTCGGGSRNQVWQQIRARLLGVPVMQGMHTEAAYGAAKLARCKGIM